MKPTFRQFLEDISVDARVYTGNDADDTIDDIQRSINAHPRRPRRNSDIWKKLPVDFGHEGFTVLYRKVRYGEHDVALVDDRDMSGFKMPFGFSLPKDPNRVAVNVHLENMQVELLDNGGRTRKLHGVMTNVLSGNRAYRGSGLAPLLYKTLVDNGQVLFSSNSQTPGGQSTWRRLIKSVADTADIAVVYPPGYYLAKLLARNAEQNEGLLDLLKVPQNKRKDVDVIEDRLEDNKFLVVGSISSMDEEVYGPYPPFWVVAPKGALDDFKKFAVQIR